jgi:hypothetical protein
VYATASKPIDNRLPTRFGKGDKEAADQAAVDVMRRVMADIKVGGVGHPV